MTHRKDPIDRVNCCHRVWGHSARRLTSLSKGPLRVMNVFYFPSVACGDVVQLCGARASLENKSFLYGARRDGTVRRAMHTQRLRCSVCRDGRVGLTATTSSFSSPSRPRQHSHSGTAHSWRKEIIIHYCCTSHHTFC